MDQVNRLKQQEGIDGGEGGGGNLHRRPPPASPPTSTTTTFSTFTTPGSLAIPGQTGNLPIVPPHPHATIEPFIQDSLKQSIDLPAYISWQTLSTEVTHRLRQGSLRINQSNQLEFTSLEDGGKDSEKTPLIDQITSRQRKSPDSPAIPVRYPDVNANDQGGKGAASSWKVGVFLLVNTALGAGILNYPAAYDRLGGIWISTVLQAIVLLMMASTMLALVFCADLHRDTTYHDVLRSMCGNRAQQLAAASIMCTCFGINVTFLVIIGDQFDRLFGTFIGPDFCTTLWYSRNFVIPVVAVCFIWPISYFKRLDFLRYVSTVGIFAMIYVVFLNVYEYFALEVTPGVIKTQPSSVIEVATSLPVIFFAYQSHEIVLPIYSSMAKPRSKNFIKSTAASLTLLFLIYTMGGTYGYLTFGSKVIADIIMMYDARDPVVTSGIIALIIKMVTTYPPLMFCGRGAFDGLYAEWRQLSAEAFIRGERWRRLVITTFWNAAVLMLAIVTPNITVAIEMLGSLAACNVFVFPGMCMVSLARRHLNGYYGKLKNERRMLRRLEGSGHWTLVWSALALYGAFIILFGVAMFGMVFVQVYNNMSEAAAAMAAARAAAIVAGGSNSTASIIPLPISTSALCGLHHV